MPSQAVSPSPEEARYRLSVAEGLLSALGSGPLALTAATRFLDADELTVAQARTQLREEAKRLRKLPLRATSGKKGSFHGMHGRERAVRSRGLLPGAGVFYCPSCNSVKPSATAACPVCGAPADPAAPTDTGGAQVVSTAAKVTEAVQTLVREGPPKGSLLCQHCGASLNGEKAAGGKIDCPVCGTPNNVYGGGNNLAPGLTEATVVGNPSVPGSPSSQTATPWGGVPPFAAADPDGDGVVDVPSIWDQVPKPPNLREATGWSKCGNCIFFFKGCNLYGLGRDGDDPDVVSAGPWPVDDDDVCDSHESVLTPTQLKVTEATYKAVKGRGGTPAQGQQFDALHPRQPKGRTGGGKFAEKPGEAYGTPGNRNHFQRDQVRTHAHVAEHGLSWAGQTFHDVGSFKKWLGDHGVSWQHFESVHAGAAAGLAVHEKRHPARAGAGAVASATTRTADKVAAAARRALTHADEVEIEEWTWDPAKHHRGRGGKFIDMLRQMETGDHIKIAGSNATVHRTEHGFRYQSGEPSVTLHKGTGSTLGHPTFSSANEVAWHVEKFHGPKGEKPSSDLGKTPEQHYADAAKMGDAQDKRMAALAHGGPKQTFSAPGRGMAHAPETKPAPTKPQWDPIAYTKHQAGIQPGHKVEARWTNSGMSYRVPATVHKVNKASVSVHLDEPVHETKIARDPATGKLARDAEGKLAWEKGAVIYPQGHKINVPLFGMHSGMDKWSHNNGVFPRESTGAASPGLPSVTAGFVQDPKAGQMRPGMKFAVGGASPGTAEVIGPSKHGTMWDVRRPDGSIQPMRPSTILSAPEFSGSGAAGPTSAYKLGKRVGQLRQQRSGAEGGEYDRLSKELAKLQDRIAGKKAESDREMGRVPVGSGARSSPSGFVSAKDAGIEGALSGEQVRNMKSVHSLGIYHQGQIKSPDEIEPNHPEWFSAPRHAKAAGQAFLKRHPGAAGFEVVKHTSGTAFSSPSYRTVHSQMREGDSVDYGVQLADVRRRLSEATDGVTITRLRARERVLARRVQEATDSMMKATVHEPVGKPGGPGLWKHKGLQLPAYIQHIANDLKAKHGESGAIRIAVGVVKNWCSGKGNVRPDTRAAACKAVAEWAKVRAKAHALSAGSKAAKAVSEAVEWIEANPAASALIETVVPPPVPEGYLLETPSINYIARVARHLHTAKGKTLGEAVAIAVNATRRKCQEAQAAGVESGACGAVAAWEHERAAANLERVLPSRYRGRTLSEAEFDQVADEFELLYAAAREVHRPFPPSLNYTNKLLAEVGLE